MTDRKQYSALEFERIAGKHAGLVGNGTADFRTDKAHYTVDRHQIDWRTPNNSLARLYFEPRGRHMVFSLNQTEIGTYETTMKIDDDRILGPVLDALDAVVPGLEAQVAEQQAKAEADSAATKIAAEERRNDLLDNM